MWICWCVTEINYRMHGASIKKACLLVPDFVSCFPSSVFYLPVHLPYTAVTCRSLRFDHLIKFATCCKITNSSVRPFPDRQTQLK